MTLSAQEYKIATKAHSEWILVYAKGVLLEGKLKNVNGFGLVDTTGELFD